jgi:quinoprotein glucose dehydrogenase
MGRLWRYLLPGACGVAIGTAGLWAMNRAPAVDKAVGAGADWPTYLGDPGLSHYSRLDQINTANVASLTLAWSVDTGDAIDGEGFAKSDMEANPLVVGGRMYVVTPKGRLFCLDPATGKVLWIDDPANGEPVTTKQRLRGVSYWSDGRSARILYTFRQSLFAVDAVTGRPIVTFGKGGRVDLREGLWRALNMVTVGAVSPGTIYKDMLILGTTGNMPGDVRAYDVRTGAIRWTFHTIPHPGERGYRSWPKDAWKTQMGANAWSGLTLDGERGIVYLPLGSAGMGAKDFYGADRPGDNLYGTALVALDANNGKYRWHFQFVHHDLWDRDPPTPPTLVMVRRGGRDIAAVAQPTKSGHLFIFDRVTGKSLFPIVERPVEKSDIPGEVSAATQPVPLAPAPFARQHLTASLLTTRTPAAAREAARMFAERRSRGPFDPPSLQGTIIFPGLDGGAEFGGAAYDPQTRLIYINSNEMAWTLKLRPRAAVSGGSDGAALYADNCSACHGVDRKGSPPEFPSLINVGARLTPAGIARQIMSGGGRMPGFPQLDAAKVGAIVSYLQAGTGDAADPSPPARPRSTGVGPPAGFVFDGYKRFLDSDGYPAIAPPWGTLTAIDVGTGRFVWRIPFGEYPELAASGLGHSGSENYGGAVVTAGGLLLIGATVFDNKLHAYDKRNGRLLWEMVLPAAVMATPATYMANGRQFVVVSAGGGKNPKAKADAKIMAFALPKQY